MTIEQPANTSFTPLNYNFTANQTQTIDLTPYITSIETSAPDTIQNTGLHITSTADINVYYEVRSSGNNTDIFALKSDNALGTAFYIPAQSFWENADNYPQAFSMFLVVATEDNTLVTITPANTLVGHTANQAFSITLNRGETYYARSASRLATGHLGGSEVTSDKPIAITIADDSNSNDTYGGCRDLAGDQMVPVDRIGSEYIIVKGFLKKGGNDLDDKVYILAIEDNTQIYLNGNTNPDYTLNAGEQQEVSLGNTSLYITSSADVYVLHVTGFGCEVGLALLPSIYCTGSEKATITRSTSSDFYLLLLVPEGSEADFRTNGDDSTIKTSDFSQVSGAGGRWMMARLKIGTNKIGVGSATEITNLTSLFHVGVINGGSSSGCMYGYFSDYASVITDSIYHF